MPSNEFKPLPPVRVLCAADAAYAAPLCVMLVSLVINHAPVRKLEIYVMGTSIPEEARRKIEASILANRPHFDISALHWLSPNKDILQGLESGMHITFETYSRLLAPAVLPEECDRVLYLDSDMVILSDLSALYDACDDSSILAVRDMEIGNVSGVAGVYNYAELGIAPDAHYFNAGVVLMNLKRWRAEPLTDRILEYLKVHKEGMHFWDQGAMNAVLHDSWREVDGTWNQHRGILFPKELEKLGYSREDWRRIMYHPRIVHYTGPEKPWQPPKNRLRLPRYSYFFEYLAKTRYADAYTGDPLERLLGFKLYFLLWQKVREAYLFLSGKNRKSSQEIPSR